MGRFLPSFVLVLLPALVATPSAIPADNPPPADSTNQILRDLSSQDYQTKRKAIRAAEGHEEPEIVDRILAIAATDPNPNQRGFAAEVLGQVKRPEAFDVLVQLAQSAEPGPRMAAFVALGRRGGPRALPVLLAGLEGGFPTRGYAVKGLGLLGNPEAFEPIRDLYATHGEEDILVAEFAPEALLALDTDRALTFLLPRLARVETPPPGVPRDRLKETRRQTARLTLAKTLGSHGGAVVVSAMTKLLESGNHDLRHAALRALEEAADSTAVPAVIARIKSEPEDRPSAARVLRRAADPRGVPALIGILQDASEDTRAAAAEALGSIGDRSAAKALATALSAEDQPRPMILMLDALARLGDRRSLTAVAGCLDNPDRLPQPAAISAIWGFPWNTDVSDVALWAFLTIRDGKEPFPKSDVWCFHPGLDRPPRRRAAEIRAAKLWFDEHRDDPALRYD